MPIMVATIWLIPENTTVDKMYVVAFVDYNYVDGDELGTTTPWVIGVGVVVDVLLVLCTVLR